MSAIIGYPTAVSERNHWVLEMRAEAPPKNVLDAWKPYAFLHETEASGAGGELQTATIFLTNRECPYRCLMCDLWINTLDRSVPAGAIPAQIDHALDRLPHFAARAHAYDAQIKLYNAGSFFDPGAMPPDDYPSIARSVEPFGRVIVECHPALVGERLLSFRDLLSARLEVAIGLETAHPATLASLNKRFTLADFRRSAEFLHLHDIDLRVFLLVRPPFMSETEGVYWAKRSLEAAFDAGASVCCLIPTRGGNGAMERLAASGNFAPPVLRSLEACMEFGLRLAAGRVFADLWDIERLYSCECSPERAGRLAEMNRTQTIPPPIECEACQTEA